MLEVTNGLTISGGMYINGSWCDVYCDEYGAAIVEDESGCWYLSEFNLGKSMDWSDSLGVKDMIDKDVLGECVGAVFAGDGSGRVFVIRSEVEFEIRTLWEMKKPTERKVFDMSGEYDPTFKG